MAQWPYTEEEYEVADGKDWSKLRHAHGKAAHSKAIQCCSHCFRSSSIKDFRDELSMSYGGGDVSAKPLRNESWRWIHPTELPPPAATTT